MIEYAWAQDAAVSGSALPGLIFSYAPLLLIVGVFYLLVLRPQSQQARAHAELLKNLAKGDAVATQSGLWGMVSAVDDKSVKLKVTGDTTLMLDKMAIVRRLTEAERKALKV